MPIRESRAAAVATMMMVCALAGACGPASPGPSSGTTTGGAGPGSGGRGTASGGAGAHASGGSGGSGGSAASGGATAGTGGAATGSGGNSAGTSSGGTIAPGTGGANATGGDGAGSGGRGIGTGGAGTAGAGGSGGATATGGGGGSGVGAKLGTGGPFPFPQNKKSANCSVAMAATAAASVQSAYDEWKTTFVSATGAGAAGNLRVVRTTDNNDTVSEGIGYGMLAAAYMADRPTFDGLWGYAKAHLDAKGLMNWKVSATGTVIGEGSATDADEDIAWALVMASNQWSSAAYLGDARAMITALLTNSIAADGMLKPGDGWGPSNVTYPDYFSPAYFRVFAAVTGNARWTGDIMDRNYAILAKVTGTYGLVPDSSNSTYQISGNYGYDACRTPWRIAMDYCFNDEPRAQAYLAKVGAFFNGIGAANIGDSYSPAGMALSMNKNMAFIGPAGVAGMAGFPMLLNDAFAFGAQNLGDKQYYPQSLKIVTMLMMSGNFLDYTR